VLSGTGAIVPSGTRSSCYQGPKSSKTPAFLGLSEPLNLSNSDSFGICLTDPELSTFADNFEKEIPGKGKGRP
jgi:hypothetical protein